MKNQDGNLHVLASTVYEFSGRTCYVSQVVDLYLLEEIS